MRLNIDRELKSFRLMQGSMDRIGLGLETLENLGSIRTEDPWSKEETNELKLNAIKKRVREVKIPFTSGNAIEDFKLLNFDTNKQFRCETRVSASEFFGHKF